MLFYVLTALIAIALVAWIIHPFYENKKYHYRYNDWLYLALQFAWKPILGAIAVGVALLLSFIPASIWHDEPVLASTETYALKALSDDERTQGSVFLLVGAFSENKTVSYIREDGNGGLVLREVDADVSTIYERDDDPSMSIYTWQIGNVWFAPLPANQWEQYGFTVPVGSVSSNFSLEP